MGAKRVWSCHLSEDAFMKCCARLIVILLLSATAAFAAAPGKTAKWFDDFAAAKAAARKEGKPILANFTGSDWCPWCIKLENEILGQKAFLDEMSTWCAACHTRYYSASNENIGAEAVISTINASVTTSSSNFTSGGSSRRMRALLSSVSSLVST